jgi:hypothetical protein
VVAGYACAGSGACALDLHPCTDTDPPFVCPDVDIGWSTGEPAYSDSTSGLTDNFTESCEDGGDEDGPDISMEWTAPSSGCFEFSTTGSAFDTVLKLYDDCGGAMLDCNDDYSDLTSLVAFEVESGMDYIIVVDGYGEDDSGPFDLTIIDRSLTAACGSHPAVYSAGTISVPASYMADLDAGVLDGDDGDIWWYFTTSTERDLRRFGGALLAVMGTSPVDYFDCAGASLSWDPIDASGSSYSDLPPGTHVCALTNEGRYSTFEVLPYTIEDGYPTLELEFTTWYGE